MNKAVNMPNISDSPPLKEVLAASGAPLHEPETRREHARALEEALQPELDMLALDQRIEATMNVMRLCAIQRGNEDYVAGDGAEFRVIMQSCDQIVGGKGFVSRGFGEPVRTAMNLAVQEALAKVAARTEKQGEAT
jgi:hypothetical protein